MARQSNPRDPVCLRATRSPNRTSNTVLASWRGGCRPRVPKVGGNTANKSGTHVIVLTSSFQWSLIEGIVVSTRIYTTMVDSAALMALWRFFVATEKDRARHNALPTTNFSAPARNAPAMVLGPIPPSTSISTGRP